MRGAGKAVKCRSDTADLSWLPPWFVSCKFVRPALQTGGASFHVTPRSDAVLFGFCASRDQLRHGLFPPAYEDGFDSIGEAVA